MTRLTLEPLSTADAHEYWRVYLEGRTDLPTRDLRVHLERYLSLPPEEQRSHYAFRLDGRIVGAARILPGTIAGFSMTPACADQTKAAVLKAVDLVRAQGAESITATFEDRYGPDFSAIGFRRQFARIRMEAPTQRRLLPPALSLRPPEEKEIAGLAKFLMEVYDGHFEQRFGMHVGPEPEWREYVAATLKGDVGQFLPDASFVHLECERIVGAVLITHWMGMPLVAELGVSKDRRGKGLARALLQAAMNRLVDRDEPRIALYATVGNDPAIRLYAAMAFNQVGGQTVTAVLE